jgi:hypothetical protein
LVQMFEQRNIFEISHNILSGPEKTINFWAGILIIQPHEASSKKM